MSLGRKPMGPKLVEHLEGSPQAKERLEVILETIAGGLSIAQACERLGIKEAMFYRLRTRVLEVGLANLEPRPLGRPRRETSPLEEEHERLRQRVEELEQELQIAEVRRELAHVLPHVVDEEEDQDESDEAAQKKTSPQKDLRRRRQALQRKQAGGNRRPK